MWSTDERVTTVSHFTEENTTWQHLLDAMADGVLVVGDDGLVVAVNRALCALSGYDEDELVGGPVERLVPEAQRQRHRDLVAAFVRRDGGTRAHGSGLDFALRRRDGATVVVDIALSAIDDGQGRFTLALLRDVGPQRRNELEREQSARQFQLAFENSMAPMTFTDAEDRIIAANPAFCELLGRPLEDFIGRDSRHFTYPTDVGVTEGSLDRVRDHGASRERYVKRYLHRDGHVIVVEVSRAAAYDDEGNLLYSVFSERDVTEERVLTAQLAHQALHDPLTGLANRALVEDRLAQTRANVARRGGYGAVLMLDLDDFKIVNDAHGHLVGDQLLIAVARRLEEVARTSDTLSRYGGDEFLYLVEGAHRAEEARNVAERLLGALMRPFTILGHEIEQRASIGVAVWDASAPPDAPVLEEADLALYEAKRLGRNRYAVFAPSMRQYAMGRHEQLQELRRAIRGGEIVMHYQPMVEAAGGQVVGFEALVRWQHPTRGLLAPSEFLPLAESSDVLHDLGVLTLREATRAAARWPTEHGRPLYVTVNLAARQFYDDGLVPLVVAALDESGLDPQRLVLEVAERVALLDVNAAATTIAALREVGVGVALDQFGAGLSSLSYLMHLQLEFVKIDQSFVRPAHGIGYNDALVGFIVALGEQLGVAVLAEGVETADQLGRLRDAGCTLGQGFLYSPAVAGDEVGALLAAPAWTAQSSTT